MKVSETPYKCHLVVCTNVRDSGRKSCGSDGGVELKQALKALCNQRGWRGVVRVSAAGCLGLCDSGPNIMLYPQRILFSSVTQDDLPLIVDKVAELIGKDLP